MYATSLLFLALPLAARAHFVLRYPTPFGPSAANEETAPCGGYSFSENTPVTNFHVEGDSIAYASSHPDVKVLYRVVQGNKADGSNLEWDQVLPIIQQFGSGSFCEPAVTVPSSYAGKSGILQVVQNAVDGMLYACAYVKFVPGKGTPPSVCMNDTGVDAEFASDASLSALMSGGGSSPSGSQSAGGPSSTNSPSSASLQSLSIFGCIIGAAVALAFNVGL
ncbi:hypothetical protein TWF696_002402 [Orbilia brochopaga]|uniref:Copper acquisition factor BIM1-like domain-containing protein n=1 Tax=Orbilia brochopaga TaxID=3140254 RepID=A0AAV9U8H9_9PEZI